MRNRSHNRIKFVPHGKKPDGDCIDAAFLEKQYKWVRFVVETEAGFFLYKCAEAGLDNER